MQMAFKSEIPVRLIQKMGGDSMVVAAAKVSTSGDEALKFAGQENAEANSGLINFLMAHRHGTPFEHSALTFFVNAPIFVWREWHRHRIGFSYNETDATGCTGRHTSNHLRSEGILVCRRLASSAVHGRADRKPDRVACTGLILRK